MKSIQHIFPLLAVFAMFSTMVSAQTKPEVWLCAGRGTRLSELMKPGAQWTFVKQHVAGIKIYIDQINQVPPEDLAALARLAKENQLQIAVEIGGCLGDRAILDNNIGEWSAKTELARIERFYAAGGRVDFLDLDGPIRRLLHSNRPGHEYFDSIEKAADQLVRALRVHRKAHPETQYWLLTNFPNWGWRGGVAYYARGLRNQNWGDYDQVVRIVLAKLREAGIALAGVTVDNPYDYMIGAQPAVNLDPKTVDWLARIRSYEEFAHEQKLTFNLTVNSARGGQESDELFYKDTLQMVAAYLKAGGHPTRWFVQSWYPYPAQIVPEDAPYSITALTKAVIERLEVASAPKKN
ncbi:MAG: hypothetical protein EPN23_10350 [Verrucomicrobia bacterium]|nr:MAG: hypothetical protein EPN23_10350 [Verrucomicrobiota bacterium]